MLRTLIRRSVSSLKLSPQLARSNYRVPVPSFSRSSSRISSRLDGFRVTNSLYSSVLPPSTRFYSDLAKESVRIGDISAPVSSPKRPEYVPVGSHDVVIRAILDSQWALEHIQWMLQKDSLRQDFALLGSPGYLRRRLIMRFCEILGREMEFISLSRDTSEADIKQRRDIESKTARFSDQCALRAATEGRILVIEGLEKAERNILPIINNLLENREMSLEDGRFLVSSERYEQLMKENGYSAGELDKLRLVRVHPNFRVIALSLPAPKYPGNPLDPPLRSRFQARFVGDPSVSDMNSVLRESDLGLAESDLLNVQQALMMSKALRVMEKVSKGSYTELRADIPELPQRSFLAMVKMYQSFPNLSLKQMLATCYPWKLINVKKAALTSPASIIHDAFERFGINKAGGISIDDFFFDHSSGKVELKSKGTTAYKFQLENHHPFETNFIWTSELRSTLAAMLISHLSGSDLALIGPKGSGKSSLVRQFALVLGYEVETQLLFKDLNQRDLLQRRITLENGDTAWQNSNLVDAALKGNLALLDNVDRLHKDTLAALQSLIVDREAFLPNGYRLVSSERYDELLTSTSQEELTNKGILRVHPKFRVIAIGDLPTSKNDYFTLELANCFNVHEIPEMDYETKLSFLQKAVPDAPIGFVKKVATFSKNLQPENEFKSMPFSLRHSIRSLKLAVSNKDDYPESGNLPQIISEALLAKFLPQSTKAILHSILKRSDINPETPRTETRSQGLKLLKSVQSSPSHLVPKILFYENERHQRILNDMTSAFSRNEPLLLIGNQGTGKNKLADYFLQINTLPRQYIQLHRDTTVSSLTSQPSIVEGVITWEDSPLVKAVRFGYVLVIDEADKAEVEVVTILKNLVDGEMTLADQRRILSKDRIQSLKGLDLTTVIPIHENFRLIVLANRPGWPFLGNNFFRECGDLFSTHSVDNPDVDSEVQLLKQYAPDLDEDLLRRISTCFDELRKLHDEGLLTYPYSTREVVNVVKHLSRYPNDPLPQVLENVFSFDVFNDQAKHRIVEAFKSQGMSLSEMFDSTESITSKPTSRTPLRIEYVREKVGKTSQPKVGKVDPDNKPHIGGNKWAGGTGGYDSEDNVSFRRDTAGLGGVGGPFRMGTGHPVHQVSDEAKRNVDKEVLRQAREMATSGLQERLKEIHMSEYDSSAYESYYNQVRLQIQQMRVILEGLEAQNNDARYLPIMSIFTAEANYSIKKLSDIERFRNCLNRGYSKNQPSSFFFKGSAWFWFKNQTTGDLDENKLVEGVTGEKTVFKRRIPPEKNTPNFHPQNKPKRIRFVIDLSASMYRFDGYDRRLRKMMETMVMVMESLEGFESKILYSIVGHSGDSDEIRLVDEGRAPKNRRERLQVLQSMVAHSQYCWPGDQTIDATKKAIEAIAKEEADDHFVFVISDANFDRYRISPEEVGSVLTSNEKVKAYAIFIASLAEGTAQNFAEGLPLGRGFACLNTADLPPLFQKMLTSHVLNN